jgi:protein-L-isoaspartate(D-aspartate) O-methyltransferase
MDAVSAAFEAMPRSAFLPRHQQGHAAFDGPLDLGHGQTCSQPRTVAAMLRLLAVQPGDRVLDVGAGSGWTTALLAHLTGPGGSVVGVELEPELATSGAVHLAGTGQPWARIDAAAPGVLGVPDEAPYDRVLVSAEADEVPGPLLDQLASPGRLVIPVAGQMLLVVRDGEGRDRVTRHGRYRFVPLR